MSSTPLFDAIARRRDTTTTTVPAPTRAPVPTSPLSAPVGPAQSTFVPAALVAAIDQIPAPAPVVSARPLTLAVRPEQLALVEAVADALTHAVVDAVALELDRIQADGFVRA